MLTLDAERRRLRYQIAGLGNGQGRRYPPALRRRVVAWVAAAEARGWSRAAAAAEFGVPPRTVVLWGERQVAEAPKLVAVEVVDGGSGVTINAGGEPILVMPSGVRVVGASVDQLAQILRVLG